MCYKDLVQKRLEEISKEYNGDFKKFAEKVVDKAGRPQQSNYKLWDLTDLILGQNAATLAHKYDVDDEDYLKFYCGRDSTAVGVHHKVTGRIPCPPATLLNKEKANENH